jgi:hypothetical protein
METAERLDDVFDVHRGMFPFALVSTRRAAPRRANRLQSTGAVSLSRPPRSAPSRLGKQTAPSRRMAAARDAAIDRLRWQRRQHRRWQAS